MKQFLFFHLRGFSRLLFYGFQYITHRNETYMGKVPYWERGFSRYEIGVFPLSLFMKAIKYSVLLCF